ANGQEGFVLARAVQPKAIVLGAKLPGLSGWDVFTLLRSQPDTSAIPVIVLRPADVTPPVVGPAKFLSKPLTEESLATTVEALNITSPARSLILANADEELAAVVERVVERDHWKTVTVARPIESTDDVTHTASDAIIFDVSPSVPAGLELLQELRVNEHTR